MVEPLDSPGPPYDRDRLRSLLSRLVAGRGTVHWYDQADGRSSALLTPAEESQGSPIYLTVIDDEVVVTAGLGSKIFFASGEPEDEDRVIEVISAIIAGGATEYGFPVNDGRGVNTGLVIVGSWGNQSFDTRGAVRLRQLPAWPDAGS